MSRQFTKADSCLLIFIAIIGLQLSAGMAHENGTTAVSSTLPLYRQTDVHVDKRVSDLIGRMTAAEKARQLDMYFGGQDLLDQSTQTIAKTWSIEPGEYTFFVDGNSYQGLRSTLTLED